MIKITMIKMITIMVVMMLKPRISAVTGATLSLFVDRKVKGGQGGVQRKQEQCRDRIQKKIWVYWWTSGINKIFWRFYQKGARHEISLIFLSSCVCRQKDNTREGSNRSKWGGGGWMDGCSLRSVGVNPLWVVGKGGIWGGSIKSSKLGSSAPRSPTFKRQGACLPSPSWDPPTECILVKQNRIQGISGEQTVTLLLFKGVLSMFSGRCWTTYKRSSQKSIQSKCN